jgi:hypothetical protein
MNGSGTLLNLATRFNFPFLLHPGFYSRLTARACIGTLVGCPDGAQYIYTHTYTRVYIHIFYQIDIRKWDFSSLYYRFVKVKETGSHS